MLIEFLYQNFKHIIKWTLIPLYIGSHFMFEQLCTRNNQLIGKMNEIAMIGFEEDPAYRISVRTD